MIRSRICRSNDDFKIRFCESTPRQPEIRIRSEGGQKKQDFLLDDWIDARRGDFAVRIGFRQLRIGR